MATTILNNQRSTSGGPYAYFTISVETLSRSATSVDIRVTVRSNLANDDSRLGEGPTMGLGCYLHFFDSAQNRYIELKEPYDDAWAGTDYHYASGDFTLPVASNVTSVTDVSVEVYRTGSAEGNFRYGAQLDTTSCSNFTIPQGIAATEITSVTSGTTDYAPVVKFTPSSSDLKYKIAYSYGNWTSGQSSLISPASTSEQTYNGYTITGSSIATYLPNSPSGTFTATLYTYASDGTTLIGSKTKTFTVTLNASYKPTVFVNTPTDTGGLVPSSWGIFVQGKSKLSYTITGTPSTGSTISSYSSTVEGVTYNTSSVETGFISQSGSIVASVVDSRGRSSGTISRTYTVYPYAAPVITTATAERCLQDGTLSDQGTYVKYSFSATVSSCNGNNTATYQLGYRVHNTGSYTYITINNGATNVIIPNATFNANTSYDIQFLASDYFTSTPVVVYLIVHEGFRLVHYNKNKKAMAVGKISTATGSTKLLEVALPTNISENVNSTGNITTTADMSANNYSGKWGGYTNSLGTTMSSPSNMLVLDGTTIKKASVPSSGIYASGSNNNGYYIKFTDGTMICWKSVSPTTSITNGWGSLYESTSAASFGNWAQEFYATPTISVTKTSGQGCWLELVQNVSKTSCGSTYFVSAVSRSNVTPTVNIIGYGRWKA